MKLYFSVDRIRPDQRQYRQTEIEIVPYEPFVVEVEISDRFRVEDDIISLEGLKAIVQACDLVFMGTSVSPQTEFDEDVQLDFD